MTRQALAHPNFLCQMVMYTWLGWVLPQTILTYSLHRAQMTEILLTVPENLSNDPDISYNPILSVNGTHVFVEWTDQDDSGHTQIKSKTLPHTTVVSQNNAESYAELSGDLNSTVSSSALLQGQNSTYVGNESRTEIQTENMSEAVTLNRPTLASDWDPSSLSSNSNSSLVPQLRTYGHDDHSRI